MQGCSGGPVQRPLLGRLGNFGRVPELSRVSERGAHDDYPVGQTALAAQNPPGTASPTARLQPSADISLASGSLLNGAPPAGAADLQSTARPIHLPPVRSPGATADRIEAGGPGDSLLLSQATLSPSIATAAVSASTIPSAQAEAIETLPAPLEEVAAAGAPVLTLNLAIATALQRDPVLASGFQDISQASAEWVTTTLRPNPELEIVQSLLPLGRPWEADVNEGGPPQFDVMLAYPIDWYLFGKRAAAMRSAAAEVRVSRADYADLIRQRVLETAIAYYNVMEAQAWIDLARQDTDNLLLVERVTAIAVENGALPRVELSRIRLDRLNSQQTLRETIRDLQVAKAELQALIGGLVPMADPDGDFRVSDQFQVDTEGGSLPPISTDIEQALAIAVANRPDIQALNLRIAQGRAEMESQRREAYPEVAPMLGYTRQFQQRAIGFPDANSWGVGVAMTLPVSDRNQGNRLLATAQWRQSQYELQAGIVQLRAEVVSVAAELETARVNAEAIAEDQLRLAEEVRDAIRQAYEAGGRPLIDVLDSQRNYRETYGNYISSRADYLRALQRFNAAVGSQVLPGSQELGGLPLTGDAHALPEPKGLAPLPHMP
jgi:outer membrane protein, heavy metal efflux system